LDRTTTARGRLSFTTKWATSHFADPEFDGEPVQIYEPGANDPITPPDDVPPTGANEEPIPPTPGDDEVIVDGEPPDITIQPGDERPRKIYVDGVGSVPAGLSAGLNQC
jgi:type I restriction enzyme, R subunit